MWDEFKQGRDQYDFYHGHEELVRDSIERTHDIAWEKCEDTWIDTSVKLPKFGTPEKPAFKMLADLVKDAMISSGLAKKPEYVERMKEEMYKDVLRSLYDCANRWKVPSQCGRPACSSSSHDPRHS